VLSPIKKLFRHSEADCQEARRLSSDYLEEDLPPAKHTSIQAHLRKCGPCQAFVDTLASTIGILSRLPRISAPSSFKQAILERTTRGGQKKSP
jgi:predicted anti-sigma-YlaC factor YlaD